ncbi:hypothetical protein KR054_008911 [Drosophila jambulina]|nr:hypothetical protein KR054_008911 [Drosophila jambulina]
MKSAALFLLSVRRHHIKYRRLHIPPATGFIDKTKQTLKLRDKEAQSRELIKRAMTLYKPNELMLCFNGGKDCTVLLDIVAKLKPPFTTLRAVYVKPADPFEELERFIDSCAQRYELQLMQLEGLMKLAFEQLVQEDPQLRAMFLGCRRTDPNCGTLPEMLPCDNGWPALMRIFPLLEWSYHDIWSYLRVNDLPYCCLYDQGYTSLGDRSSTDLNSSLLTYDEKQGKLVYRAAYELEDPSKERISRGGGRGHGQEAVGESK